MSWPGFHIQTSPSSHLQLTKKLQIFLVGSADQILKVQINKHWGLIYMSKFIQTVEVRCTHSNVDLDYWELFMLPNFRWGNLHSHRRKTGLPGLVRGRVFGLFLKLADVPHPEEGERERTLGKVAIYGAPKLFQKRRSTVWKVWVSPLLSSICADSVRNTEEPPNCSYPGYLPPLSCFTSDPASTQLPRDLTFSFCQLGATWCFSKPD